MLSVLSFASGPQLSLRLGDTPFDRALRMIEDFRKHANITKTQAVKAYREFSGRVVIDRPRKSISKFSTSSTKCDVQQWEEMPSIAYVAKVRKPKRPMLSSAGKKVITSAIAGMLVSLLVFPSETTSGTAINKLVAQSPVAGLSTEYAGEVLGQVDWVASSGVKASTPKVLAVPTSSVKPEGSSKSFGIGFALTEAATLFKPRNWIDSETGLVGSSANVAGAYWYAILSGYEFAEDKNRLEQMQEEGTLVELKGKYINVNSKDVSRPWVLPVTNAFVNRLGAQYFAYGCGKLDPTSASRDIKFQKSLSNGSELSVHPTGMAVDLRNTGLAPRCLTWLKETLLEIQATKRINVTEECGGRDPKTGFCRSPHLHVDVAQQEYAEWLKYQLDPETKVLAQALFNEGGPKETDKGYQAIASVIHNRVRSSEFPDTLIGVVVEGAKGQINGCQFSYVCDGKPESIGVHCIPGKMDPCQARWNRVVRLAKRWKNLDTSISANDITGGAVLYYSKSMDKNPPDWHVDMKKGTFNVFGGHRFACSTKRGDDACTTPDKSSKGVKS